MTTAAVGRDPFMPARPPGLRSSLALALLAHALLIAGLAYSVDWHADTPAAVEAELWSALPQQAAPRAVAPEPKLAPPPAARVTHPAPTPAPRALPDPSPAPRVDPQIAIEKAREARRVEAQEALEEQEKARRDRARRDDQAQKKLLADRQQATEKQAAADKQRLDKQKADKQADREQVDKQRADRERIAKESADKSKAEKAVAVAQAAAYAAQIKRMAGLAGASGDEKSTGTAMKSSGPSASYGGRIVARIKPNIVFPDAVDGNPTAIVEVKVAPDGTIIGKRLEQSSGVKAWDDAVLRAIDRTDGLPRDIDGRVPPVLSIKFRPRDL